MISFFGNMRISKILAACGKDRAKTKLSLTTILESGKYRRARWTVPSVPVSHHRLLQPSATVCLLLSLANASFAQKPELKVLSGRPDMVSGGSALVQVSGHSLDSLKVELNGRPLPGTFRSGLIAGTLVGRIERLNPGRNLLQVRSQYGTQKIILINHPIGGPVFSGPHQQPFICQSEFFGLEKAVDDDCNAPTRVEYFYRSTKRLNAADAKKQSRPADLGPGYLPLHPSEELPTDVAMTTTTDGKSVKFIVHVETGTINRGVYRIAFLHQPGQRLPDPWTKTPEW